MKGILVSTKNPKMKLVEVEDKLETFYELLGCDSIDIVSRKIDDMIVNIVCDDNGLMAQKMPTALSHAVVKQGALSDMPPSISYEPLLFGDILILGYSNGGENLVGLTDEKEEFLMKQGIVLKDIWSKNEFEAVKNVEFV